MAKANKLFTNKYFPLLLLVALVIAFSITLLRQKSTVADSLYSRKWMEYAMSIVEEEREKTPPTVSSRLYAYVASIYDETLRNTGSRMQAGIATKIVIQQMFPTYYDETQDFYSSLYGYSEPLEEDTKGILRVYNERLLTDGYHPVWEGEIPTGEDKWYRGVISPYTPDAGKWQTWLIKNVEYFNVPPPPEVGSQEELAEVEKVATIVKNRTEEDNKKIMFWSGTEGTKMPAGIWQDMLYSVVDESTTDEIYAEKQRILAQSLADSFIAAWRIKYTYWTQRPSMRDATIEPHIDNPPFPSYVSGHSTISATAATVLSKLEPEKAEYWMEQAKDASHSRVTGGIHFEYDTIEGFKLGLKVGQAIVESLEL